MARSFMLRRSKKSPALSYIPAFMRELAIASSILVCNWMCAQGYEWGEDRLGLVKQGYEAQVGVAVQVFLIAVRVVPESPVC